MVVKRGRPCKLAGEHDGIGAVCSSRMHERGGGVASDRKEAGAGSEWQGH